MDTVHYDQFSLHQGLITRLRLSSAQTGQSAYTLRLVRCATARRYSAPGWRSSIASVGRSSSRSFQRLEIAEQGRDQLGHCRVDVDRALDGGVRPLGVHHVEERVHDLVAVQA